LLSTDDNTQILPSVTGKCVGEVLADRFQLVALQGNGANGSVFLARDLHLHCDIAVKILHGTIVQSSVARDALRQEILLARAITHPNVIRVHDFYLDQDCAFFTMDFIAGTTLAEVHLGETADDLALAQYIGVQLIDAIDAIHQRGIIHCDIKPQNILLDKNNQLYLSDLGLAAALTTVSHQYCTPVYSAPEVLQNGNHSPQSDYYALAVTLFQLLTNTLPFSQSDLAQQLADKLRSKIDWHVIAKKYTRWLPFLQQNLAAYPMQRCQNATELRQLWLNENRIKPVRFAVKSGVFVAAALALGVFFAAWYGLNRPGLTPAGADSVISLPLSLAILPSDAASDNPQQRAIVRLVQAVSYEQLRSQNIRLITVERVQTTVQHLGYSTPLNDRQMQDVANLLGVDLMLSSHVTLLDGQIELAMALKDMRQPLTPLIWAKRVSAGMDAISASVTMQLGAMLATFNAETADGAAAAQEIPAPAQQLYNQLMLAKANKNTEQIGQQLIQFQQRYPDLVVGYVLAAEWYQQQQNWLQAEQSYTLAVKKSPSGSFFYLLSSARLAALKEQFAVADTHYQQLLKIKPYDTALTMEYAEFLGQQNRYADASAQLQQLVQADKTNPDIWLQLGKFAIRTGDIGRAVDDYLLQAQVLYKRMKNNAGLADTLNAVGVSMQRLGKFSDAITYYKQAFALFEQGKDVQGMAKASANLGFMQFVAGETHNARQTLQQAMQYYQQLNDSTGQASTIDNLGMLAEELGEYQQAQRHFAEAFSIRTQLGDSWELTESLINLGYIYFVLSEFEQSLVYLKQAEQTAVANNDALSLIKVRQSLAQLKMQQGEWGQAFRLFKATSDDAQALGLTEDKMIADAFLAKLSGLQGNFSLAESQLKAFSALAAQEQDQRAAIEFSLWLIELYQAGAQYDNAQTQIQTLGKDVLAISNNEQRQSFSLLLINQFIATEQYEKAAAQLLVLQQQLSQHPLPRIALKAFISKQQLNLMQGQPLASLPASFEVLMRHHALERLLWLELQALYAIRQGDRETVGQVVNQVLPLLRRTTSYWRNFVYEYLQRFITNNNGTAPTLKMSDTAEFDRLLKQIPEPYRQAFIQRENNSLKLNYAG
jgi:eukaryotic-like serine/threonine-protein kinase